MSFRTKKILRSSWLPIKYNQPIPIRALFIHVSCSCTPGSWAQHTGETQTVAGLDDYIASLYWAAATMSSTGYGDIHAHDTASELIATAVMLTGLLLYGYCLSSIAATLANSAAPKYVIYFFIYFTHRTLESN